jgi:hypothetical protein
MRAPLATAVKPANTAPSFGSLTNAASLLAMRVSA